MAQRTERCRVGSAIAYGVGRSPLILAAEARDLDELSDGRLVLGLGNGTRRMLSDWHGADPAAPAVRMEELVGLVRRLWRLHEEPVAHDGRFYRLHLRPTGDVPVPLRERIPIYTAGVNPRMVEVAGRVSDGLLGHPLCGVEYLREVVHPAIAKGAEHAGREASEVAVASLVIAVIDDDADQARREAAAQIAFYCSVKTYERILEVSGFGSEGRRIRDAFAARDVEAMIAGVTDAMIDAFAVAGSVSEVVDGLHRFDEVLDHIVLYVPSFQITPDRATESALRLIAELGGARAA
jgi:probable F420-dependent oxidoreductase